MKITAEAPSNIAFVKYWGKTDTGLRLPANGSVSMNLSSLTTTTTVEFSSSYSTDEILINGIAQQAEVARVIKHLDIIRKKAGIKTRAKVMSKNSFPSSTGLSSSASGFAALTVAASHASGLSLTEKELSILARLGSGSACRSIPDGFTEWIQGSDHETSYSLSLYPPDWWNITDIVCIVNSGKKEVPTSKGMETAATSPFYQTRLSSVQNTIKTVKTAIEKKDFTLLGTITEREALSMHAVMISSEPALLYWSTGTLNLMKEVMKWRTEGLEAYFTINTGQDVHILSKEEDSEKILLRVKSLDYIKTHIVNSPAKGTHIVHSALF